LFLLDWPALEPQSTRPHMQKRRRSMRTAVAACARAVWCVISHGDLGDRRKSPVWSTEATYLLGSTAGVPEGQSVALICAGAHWSAGLNRHKIWSGRKNGMPVWIHVMPALGRRPTTKSCTWSCCGAQAQAQARAYELRTRAAPPPGPRRTTYGGGGGAAAAAPVPCRSAVGGRRSRATDHGPPNPLRTQNQNPEPSGQRPRARAGAKSSQLPTANWTTDCDDYDHRRPPSCWHRCWALDVRRHGRWATTRRARTPHGPRATPTPHATHTHT
jgi:hypothetical protein